MATVKKGGLGRGLDALFADVPVKEPASEKNQNEKKSADDRDRIQYIKIHDIMPNANQPRKTFNEEKIGELADSIKEHGIIQPIVVRKREKGYEIVAGERRWRAAIKAELSQVPCLVRELNDEQNMLIAIIENMQREDLNPIEEAEGLRQMSETFGMTQEQISKSLGKSRPYITNSMRLLKLPDYIRDSIAEGQLSAGHGRTLITVTDEKIRRELWQRIVSEGLSVREAEKLSSSGGKQKKKKPTASKKKNPDVLRVEAELKEVLGTRVSINKTGSKGKIEIEYYSSEELERLIEMLKSLR
ncbi:MAG: ParB/RepB/Spo0J family partition protein [Candidatus Fimisoma sp.]|nr:ParB/RepB/Spo0J family partition protein [Bacillota bacterium]MDY4748259.1 ParB/RepB/Spo0J family partition protein [Candidatus Fimisoma sp.]